MFRLQFPLQDQNFWFHNWSRQEHWENCPQSKSFKWQIFRNFWKALKSQVFYPSLVVWQPWTSPKECQGNMGKQYEHIFNYLRWTVVQNILFCCLWFWKRTVCHRIWIWKFQIGECLGRRIHDNLMLPISVSGLHCFNQKCNELWERQITEVQDEERMERNKRRNSQRMGQWRDHYQFMLLNWSGKICSCNDWVRLRTILLLGWHYGKGQEETYTDLSRPKRR